MNETETKQATETEQKANGNGTQPKITCLSHVNSDMKCLTCPVPGCGKEFCKETENKAFESLRGHLLSTGRKDPESSHQKWRDKYKVLTREMIGLPPKALKPTRKAREETKPIQSVEDELSELPDDRTWEDDLEGEVLPQNLDHLNRLLLDHGIKSKRKIILRRMSATDSTDIVELMNSIRETGYNTDIQKSVIRLYCKFLGCLIPPLVHDRLADKEAEGYEDFRRTPYLRGDRDLRSRRRDYDYESPDEDVDTGGETAQIITAVKEVFEGAYRRGDNNRNPDPEIKYLQSQMDSLVASNKALEAKLEEEKTKRMEQQMTLLHDEVKALKDEMGHQRTQSEYDVMMGRQNVAGSAFDKMLLLNLAQNTKNIDPEILRMFGFTRRREKEIPDRGEEDEKASGAWRHTEEEYVEAE